MLKKRPEGLPIISVKTSQADGFTRKGKWSAASVLGSGGARTALTGAIDLGRRANISLYSHEWKMKKTTERLWLVTSGEKESGGGGVA